MHYIIELKKEYKIEDLEIILRNINTELRLKDIKITDFDIQEWKEGLYKKSKKDHFEGFVLPIKKKVEIDKDSFDSWIDSILKKLKL